MADEMLLLKAEGSWICDFPLIAKQPHIFRASDALLSALKVATASTSWL